MKKIVIVSLSAIVLMGLTGCMELQYERYVSDVDKPGLESAITYSNMMKLEHHRRDQQIPLPKPETADRNSREGKDYMIEKFVKMNRELGADPVASAIFFNFIY